MSTQVVFRATDSQVRDVVRRVVEASGYRDDGGPLASLEVIDEWRGKLLWWVCYRGDEPSTWVLVHGLPNHAARPWAKRYPDASVLAREAGLEIIRESEWAPSSTACASRRMAYSHVVRRIEPCE